MNNALPKVPVTMTIAVVQMHIQPNDPIRNLARIENYVAAAKARGADLVVFPEDAICGPLTGQTAFVRYAPVYLRRMKALAVRYAIDLVPGTWTVFKKGGLYNQAHYINSDGSVAGVYRKVNLWKTEKAHIRPGRGPVVFSTRFGRVGLCVCWDISFPQMFTAMNSQGVQLVISPTYWSFPMGTSKDEEAKDHEIRLIDSLCIARAFENNIAFVYCNAAGELKIPAGRVVLSGRSQITHPQKLVGQCQGNMEEMLVVPVEMPVQSTLAPDRAFHRVSRSAWWG
ncbi:MAG: putative amidohydrolase [Polyangiales bacterium]|jgi:predicted amidohydrolase